MTRLAVETRTWGYPFIRYRYRMLLACLDLLGVTALTGVNVNTLQQGQGMTKPCEKRSSGAVTP